MSRRLILVAALFMALDCAASEEGKASFRAAERSLEFGDFPSALAEALRAVQLEPQNPKGHSLAASALNRMGRYADAEAAAERSTRLKNPNPAAFENLAYARLNLGRHQEAVAAASTAIAQDPQSADAHALRAQAYGRLGLKAEMLADLQRAAALEPTRFAAELDAARGGFPWAAAAGGAGALLAALAFMLWRRTSVAPAPPTGPAESGPRLAYGQLLADKYRLLRRLGQDGIEAWEVEDIGLGRSAVLRRMSTSERGAALETARAAAALRHRNIAAIYEILDLPDGLFLVSELVRGKTVSDLLSERRTLDPAATRSILTQVCAALDFAHRGAVSHLAVKPANIMVAEDGHVKVLGFGILRPPGGQGPAQDVYALGACYAEMSGGNAPAAGELAAAALEPDPAKRMPRFLELLGRLTAAS